MAGDDNDWQEGESKWDSNDKWAMEDKWESDNWVSSQSELGKWDEDLQRENDSSASLSIDDRVIVNTDDIKQPNLGKEFQFNTPSLGAIGFVGGFVQG